jgi:hypothetical protein
MQIFRYPNIEIGDYKMNNQMQTHLQYVDLLNEWDPFELKNGDYDTEIADTIQAIHEFDTTDKLANRIQAIYEFSFEILIPIDSCLDIAVKLLDVKNNDSCSIG